MDAGAQGVGQDGGLLAVRDVNAHVFCPRLFWLKAVEGVWLDNEHTIEGRHVHRRVDRPGGRMDAPGDVEEQSPSWETRSLWLSSVALGVSGRIDLVDAAGDGSVMPVDTKKGRSRDGELWAPDRVQLVLQAMLLEEAGYRVESIAAWYHAERRRVQVPLDEALRAEAREAVQTTLHTRQAGASPAPLVGSSRCMGCSLNAACLPDEVTRLRIEAEEGARAEAGDEVRRVVPPRADRIPLYVQEQGATVRLSGEEIVVSPREGGRSDEVRVGFGQLGQINVFGQVHLTGPAMRACMDRGVAVGFFSQGGWYRGRLVSVSNRQVGVRAAQFGAVGGIGALDVARRLVSDKIANGRTLLRRNRGDVLDEDVLRDLRTDARLALEAETPESLLGHEGAAARRYWSAYSTLLGRSEEAFGLSGRTRRPPRDRGNALLSYGYGMLTKDCLLAVEAVGLDPHCGLYHTMHHGRPSMALDLMEPFRPLVVDSLVLQMVSRREVVAQDFIEAGQEVRLKPHARRALIRGYERRMDETITHPVFGYTITYRQLLQVHARLLARFLMGELSEPPIFRTR